MSKYQTVLILLHANLQFPFHLVVLRLMQLTWSKQQQSVLSDAQLIFLLHKMDEVPHNFQQLYYKMLRYNFTQMCTILWQAKKEINSSFISAD